MSSSRMNPNIIMPGHTSCSWQLYLTYSPVNQTLNLPSLRSISSWTFETTLHGVIGDTVLTRFTLQTISMTKLISLCDIYRNPYQTKVHGFTSDLSLHGSFMMDWGLFVSEYLTMKEWTNRLRLTCDMLVILSRSFMNLQEEFLELEKFGTN